MRKELLLFATRRAEKYPNGQERYEQTMGTNGIAPNGKEVSFTHLTGKPIPNIYGSAATCSQMARPQRIKRSVVLMKISGAARIQNLTLEQPYRRTFPRPR